MDDTNAFELDVIKNIENQGKNTELKAASLDWHKKSGRDNYIYNFKWMGMPIIQLPQDIVASQELIWNIKPDVIIETGIARGGTSIFYSSMIELLSNNGKVISVDIDIREHNRKRIESHPMFKNIILIEGSSTDTQIIDKIDDSINKFNLKKAIVFLDSCHSHDHVLNELRSYSKYVKKDSYLVVQDTVIETLGYPEETFEGKPWGNGNNPMTAIKEFLKQTDRFVVDYSIDDKLLITSNTGGYLKCVY